MRQGRKGTNDILPSKGNTPVIIPGPPVKADKKPKKFVNIDGIMFKPARSNIREDFEYVISIIKRVFETQKEYFVKRAAYKRSLKTSKRPYKSVFDTGSQPFAGFGLDAVKSTGFSRYRTSAMFVVVSFSLLILVNLLSALGSGLSTKDNVMRNINDGYYNILDAKEYLLGADPVQAEEKFAHAYDNFEQALDNIQRINAGVSIFDGSPLDTSYHLLTAGEQVSLAGVNASKGIQDIMLNQNFKTGLEYLDQSITNILDAQEHISTVSMQEIPSKYREQFGEMQTQLEEIIPFITSVQADIPTLKRIVGDDYPRRYFVAFQNTYESRGMGGFMGSYGILDLEEGKITDFSVHDVYDIDWQLFQEVPAPEGLQPYMSNIHLRDANYLPDTPEAAKYIKWFYENSRGTSFDGIIFIDQTWLNEVLSLTGPVELKEYGLEINEDNYFEVLQYVIETSKEHPDGPKQILKDLAETMFADFNDSLPANEVLSFTLESLRDKHISIYFMDDDLQTLADKWNLTHRMYTSPINHDYLSVIHTNVGGNKTDKWIREKYTHTSRILPDGSVEDTLTITLDHTFTNQDRKDIYATIPELYAESREEQNRLLYILGDSPYKDFMRVYVPAESILTAIDGENIDNVLIRPELGQTIYGVQVDIDPGQTKTYTFTYKLPFSYATTGDNSYEFIAQKQFGRDSITLHKTVELSPEYKFTLESPATLGADQQSKSFDMNLNHDQYYAESFLSI